MNSATLIGRVGRDPEIRTTRGGTKVADVSLATTERWKKNGEKKEHTEWHRLTVFGPLVDVFANYVQKGGQIAIKGRLRTERWATTTGRTTTPPRSSSKTSSCWAGLPRTTTANLPMTARALPDAHIDEIAQKHGEPA